MKIANESEFEVSHLTETVFHILSPKLFLMIYHWEERKNNIIKHRLIPSCRILPWRKTAFKPRFLHSTALYNFHDLLKVDIYLFKICCGKCLETMLIHAQKPSSTAP